MTYSLTIVAPKLDGISNQDLRDAVNGVSVFAPCVLMWDGNSMLYNVKYKYLQPLLCSALSKQLANYVKFRAIDLFVTPPHPPPPPPPRPHWPAGYFTVSQWAPGSVSWRYGNDSQHWSDHHLHFSVLQRKLCRLSVNSGAIPKQNYDRDCFERWYW